VILKNLERIQEENERIKTIVRELAISNKNAPIRKMTQVR